MPFLSDGQAAIATNDCAQPKKCNEDIDKQCFFGRQEKIASDVEHAHIDTCHCLLDIATENLLHWEAHKKLSHIECPVSDDAIGCMRDHPKKHSVAFTIQKR